MSRFRPFAMPITAATIGAVMAVGVFAATRTVSQKLHDGAFAVTLEAAPAPDVRVIRAGLRDGALNVRVDGVDVTAVLEQVSAELEASLEANQDLTDAQRERVQAALEQLHAKAEAHEAPPAPEASAPESGSEVR